MKIPRKLKSVKFWVVLYCLILLGFIVFTGRVEFLSIAERLVFVPLAYLPVNLAQKWAFNTNGENKDNGK